MLHFLAEHETLLKVAVAILVVALGASVLRITLRGERSSYRARHRNWRWSTAHSHTPRHAAPEHHARHVAVVPGPSAYLGRTPDGDLALVDDEHTHELIGASA